MYCIVFEQTLNLHAHVKEKFIRGNNKPHVTKELRKAIMKRSHLKHVAIKSGCPEDMSLFKKQRNLVINLNKTTKRAFFNKIEPPKSRGKQFWKACKPLFSSKSNTSEDKILLVDNDKIISDDLKIATVFNTYFSNITHSLNIFHWNSHFKITSEDQISSCVIKYNQHPSILNFYLYPIIRCLQTYT